MQQTVSLFDARDAAHVFEPGMPHFLDGSADFDDLNDWWLDLGAVDLASAPGL